MSEDMKIVLEKLDDITRRLNELEKKVANNKDEIRSNRALIDANFRICQY